MKFFLTKDNLHEIPPDNQPLQGLEALERTDIMFENKKDNAELDKSIKRRLSLKSSKGEGMNEIEKTVLTKIMCEVGHRMQTSVLQKKLTMRRKSMKKKEDSLLTQADFSYIQELQVNEPLFEYFISLKDNLTCTLL